MVLLGRNGKCSKVGFVNINLQQLLVECISVFRRKENIVYRVKCFPNFQKK